MFGCIITGSLCSIVSVLSCVAACCVTVAGCRLSDVKINEEAATTDNNKVEKMRSSDQLSSTV